MSQSIAHALAFATAAHNLSRVERLDAQLLLLKVLGKQQTERAWLIGHDDQVLTELQSHQFIELVLARVSGQPLAYLVGEKEFFNLKLAVSPAVLVPRPDTETLVHWVLDLLQSLAAARPQIADLGTGSGAVALAIKANAAHAQVVAVDNSPQALAVAQENGKTLDLPVQWLLSDWLQAKELQGHAFDVIASNPPYIEQADVHMAKLQFEPVSALTSGADGLDDIRAIAQMAPKHLKPGAWLLLEHGWNQSQAVAQLLAQAGFGQVQHRQDLAGHIRCTGGQWV